MGRGWIKKIISPSRKSLLAPRFATNKFDTQHEHTSIEGEPEEADIEFEADVGKLWSPTIGLSPEEVEEWEHRG